MTQPCSKEKEIQEIRDMAIVSREQFKFIKEELTNIRENHLAHMQVSIENIETEIAKGLSPDEENKLIERVEKLERLGYKILLWAGLVGAIIGIGIQLAFKYL